MLDKLVASVLKIWDFFVQFYGKGSQTRPDSEIGKSSPVSKDQALSIVRSNILIGDILVVLPLSSSQEAMNRRRLEIALLRCLSLGEIREEIKKLIIEAGMEGLRVHLNSGRVQGYNIPPDHVRSPKALAYVMREGFVSSRELGRIKFDHGETVKIFIQDYCPVGEDPVLYLLRLFVQEFNLQPKPVP